MQYFISVFIGAFLVFQIQPIVSKLILPWFGGGAGVWTACLLFFQVVLLFGYFYSFVLSRFFTLKLQLLVHIGLLIVSLLFLPLTLSTENISDAAPIYNIIIVLTSGIGLPFVLLSATSPLMQNWFIYSDNTSQPYRLYAMSNLGSFLALISYPLLIEPSMSMALQTRIWSMGYGIFTCVVFCVALGLWKREGAIKIKESGKHSATSVSIGSVILWILLSSIGVVMLMSTTNAMSQNIPPVPFLWVAPLALYLLTYVLAFSDWKIYRREWWLPIFFFVSFIALFLHFISGQLDLITQVVAYSFILFSVCLICHGELCEIKPESQHATLFYLMLSLGGVIGSLLVSIGAMLLFDEFIEYPLAVACVFIVVPLSIFMSNKLQQSQNHASNFVKHKHTNIVIIACLISLLIWAGGFYTLTQLYQQYDVAKARNFYGILSVKDIKQHTIQERRLVDGSTSHGSQSLDADKSTVPLSYYRPGTGVELVLSELSRKSNIKVGIVGLGAGALSAYANDQDEYTFYELNPSVIDFAKEYFSFLSVSKGKMTIKEGDARVTLQSELKHGQNNGYDVLVIDAFSGDVIPTHLITQQAYVLYKQHIKPDGAIVVHISNRHLNLLPVVLSNANSIPMQSMFFSMMDNSTDHQAEWVIHTSNPAILNNVRLKASQSPLPLSAKKQVIWTDDYSSLLPILKVLQ